MAFLKSISVNFYAGAALPANVPSAFRFFCLGNGREINMLPNSNMIKNKEAFLNAIKTINDNEEDKNRVFDQLVFSASSIVDSQKLFSGSLDKSEFTLADNSKVKISEAVKFAIDNGTLDKKGKVVIDIHVTEGDDVYKAMQKCAKDIGITIVTNDDWGPKGVYLFNPDGTVTYEQGGQISSSIGSKSIGSCGRGYEPEKTK